MFDRIVLAFSDRTTLVEMGSVIHELPVLRLSFAFYPVYQPRDPAAPPIGGDRWTLELLFTPHQHREFVQNLLIQRILPELKDWLLKLEQPVPSQRLSRTCMYIVAKDEVQWRED